ncbi:MAG TPA: hypothetical protein VET23_06225 [Chitinophagaceae bacterium]|nr:hypothetical protein [Chitinophagaceae bacterium]
MRDNHRQKFMLNILIGFTLTTTGILLLLFATSSAAAKEELYLWGIAAAIILNIGFYSLGNAFVHKVKSDLKQRQKHREHFHSQFVEQD